MRTRGTLAALALPLALAVSACGDDATTASDPAGSSTPTSSSSSTASSDLPTPQCEVVWVEGATLPGSFQGCYEGTKRIKPDGRYCEFGKPLFTYDERFFAVRNGTVHLATKPFAQDAKYQDTLRKCSG